MVSDHSNKIIPTPELERPGDTYDMAYFLKTTGPPAAAGQRNEVLDDRVKRKKMLPQLPPLFRRKKDSLIDDEVDEPRLTSGGNAPQIIQRISKDGAKYLQIVTALGALDSTQDLYGGGLFQDDSSRVSVSRATSNLAAIETENVVSWISTFGAVEAYDDLAMEPSSILEAKALPNNQPGQDYLSIKGPSVFASKEVRDSGLSLSMISSDHEATLVGEDLADMIARAAEMNSNDHDQRNSTYCRSTLRKMASADTLTTIRSCRSDSIRRRSDGEEHLIALQVPHQSVQDSEKARELSQHRRSSVLDLDAQFGGNITKQDNKVDDVRANVRHQYRTTGRDRLRRPPPIMLPPTLPEISSFDVLTPTMVPELERGLSSSESSSFGDQPATPTPSPRTRRNDTIRKSRSFSAAHRSSNHSGPSLSQPPQFLMSNRSPPPSRSSNLTRTGSMSSMKLFNTSFPAPPFSPPPPPPTRATPSRPNTASIIPSSKHTSSSSITTYRDSLRIARLEARLERAEREKLDAERERDLNSRQIDLMEAALRAMLLTNGRLNKCPCWVLHDKKRRDNDMAATPPSSTGSGSHRASAIMQGRCRRSNSIESNGSHMSALDVFRATRVDSRSLFAQR